MKIGQPDNCQIFKITQINTIHNDLFNKNAADILLESIDTQANKFYDEEWKDCAPVWKFLRWRIPCEDSI